MKLYSDTNIWTKAKVMWITDITGSNDCIIFTCNATEEFKLITSVVFTYDNFRRNTGFNEII